MPKVEKRVARADIYRYGKKTPAKNKQGYSLDKSQPSDKNDEVIVKKGQEYYTWQRYRSARQYSLTPPKRQQLTGSAFLATVWDIEDRLQSLTADDLEGEIDDIRGELEQLRDETQESFDNMPDGLQQGDTGQLLEQRIEAVEEMINDIDAVDIDEDDLESAAEELNNISY